MTTMIDTNGREHTIVAAGNVDTLKSIGWTVKDGIGVQETSSKAPSTAREWDTIFGRR